MSQYLTIYRTVDCGALGEHEARILAKYWPGRPGSFYKRNGDPGDPPEPDEAEILSVSLFGLDFTNIIPQEKLEEWTESDWFMEEVGERYAESKYPEES